VVDMKWKNKIKKAGSTIKKGTINVAKKIKIAEKARRERISVLKLLTKEELREIKKKFDVEISPLFELTRDVYIDSIANSLSLEEIETALISIGADERVFNRVEDIKKDRKLRGRIVKKIFLKSKDEIKKAEKAVEKQDWSEIFNHIRSAIDLALREKFGFKKIYSMKIFISDAKLMGLKLPAYNDIYRYFDYGSKRLHEGEIHTSLEAEHALGFVKRFINELNTIEVTEKEINEFKNKCKVVE